MKKTLAYTTALALCLAPSCVFAQGTPKLSDDDLIKLAMSAAPEAVAKNATVMVIEADGKMRTLREGNNQ